MKTIQIIYWGWPLRFGSFKAFKASAAYFLIYKWAYMIGLWEIRKFMSKEEMRIALKEFHKKPLNK